MTAAEAPPVRDPFFRSMCERWAQSSPGEDRSTLDVIDEGIRECAELVHHAWWLQQRLLQLRSRLGGAEGRSDGQG